MKKLIYTDHGTVVAGMYELDAPIVLRSGDELVSDIGQVTIKTAPGVDAIHVARRQGVSWATIRGINFQGAGVSNIVNGVGQRGIVLLDDSKALIDQVSIRDFSWPSVFVGQATDCSMTRSLLLGGGDNGIQFEGGGIKIVNCGLVGPFANKAIDSSGPPHKTPYDIHIVHCTILDQTGQGAYLKGWLPDKNLIFANNLVIVPVDTDDDGMSPYAIIGDADAAIFAGNVVCGSSSVPIAGNVTGPEIFLNASWKAQGWADLVPRPEDLRLLSKGSSRFAQRFDAVLRRRDPGAIVAGCLVP